jgi:NADPH-dependent 7-cyano-7-deazaguanine reductase QueF
MKKEANSFKKLNSNCLFTDLSKFSFLINIEYRPDDYIELVEENEQSKHADMLQK